MAPGSTQTILEQAQASMQSWEMAFKNPARAQEQTLCRLLSIYAQTEEGRRRGAGRIGTVDEYRKAYPVRTYADYQPFIHQIMGGETSLLLNETPVGWGIPRKTTGEPRYIPITVSDLRTRVAAQRTMHSYLLSTHHFELLSGVALNLNAPSVVGKIRVASRTVEYGYVPGITALRKPSSMPVRLIPPQEEIDKLGGDHAKLDQEARFELAYQRCKRATPLFLYGDAETALAFGRYLRRVNKVYPKGVWKIPMLALSGMPGINTRLRLILRVLYGPAEIREVYAAAEGCFGQQMDEKRAWVPNYDLLFFEVQTKEGIKMLHELEPGEMGSLVVSTPVLARYWIGDTILAFEPPYFRTIGRDRWSAPLGYLWEEISSLNFGRI